MIRLVIALVGLAVFGAIFAGIYYDADNLTQKEEGAPAFRLAPGEAEQTTLQPTLAGSPILVRVRSFGGSIDVYVLEKEWSDVLPVAGRLSLDRPFSYDARHSVLGLNGSAEFTLISDGKTSYNIVFDNSDNFYDNDTAPDPAAPAAGQADILVTIRYLEDERRSLLLGYVAVVPSIVLVMVTLGRKLLRKKP